MAKTPDKAAHRVRAHGHRYADAVLFDDDVIAAGIRYDEDAPDVGETLVVRLRPGRVEPIGGCDGVARAVVLVDGVVHVLLADRRLVRLDDDKATVVRDDIVDAAPHGEGAVALDAAGNVALLGASATILGAVAGGSRVASDGQRVVVASSDGVFDVAGRRLLARGGTAVAVAGDRIAVVDGRDVHVVRGGTTVNFGVAHELHSVALVDGRLFVGSRAAGLFVLVDGDDRVRPLRPSLRARALHAFGPRLIVASDLLVATSDDGEEFVARDLAGFVRLAEKRGHAPAATSSIDANEERRR
jgi:hypothetical protein